MTLTGIKRTRAMTAAVLAAALALAGCQGTTGKGAALGAGLGGLGGLALCKATKTSGAGCLGLVALGAGIGAFIGDSIERQQQERAVYYAARSGGSSSSGTFKNKRGDRVRYTARVQKTYKKATDSDLTCRTVAVSKSVNGQAAGSSTENVCQVKVAGKPTWEAPEA